MMVRMMSNTSGFSTRDGGWEYMDAHILILILSLPSFLGWSVCDFANCANKDITRTNHLPLSVSGSLVHTRVLNITLILLGLVLGQNLAKLQGVNWLI